MVEREASPTWFDFGNKRGGYRKMRVEVLNI